MQPSLYLVPVTQTHSIRRNKQPPDSNIVYESLVAPYANPDKIIWTIS